MAKIEQNAAGIAGAGLSPRARGPAVSRGWLATAARALGLGAATETTTTGGNFDFSALHHSLRALEGKPPETDAT